MYNSLGYICIDIMDIRFPNEMTLHSKINLRENNIKINKSLKQMIEFLTNS